jgi:thymidylate kinase
MIKVTIEGPIGAGKSQLFKVLERHCQASGITFMRKAESTTADIRESKPDVLFIERQTRADGT